MCVQNLILALLLLILSSNATLLKVTQLSRHGNAVSLSNLNPEFQQNGPGHLSSTGMRQYYILGLQMRKRYIEGHPGFLNETILAKQFQISSSNLQRSLSSAHSYNQAFFGLNRKGPQLS